MKLPTVPMVAVVVGVLTILDGLIAASIALLRGASWMTSMIPVVLGAIIAWAGFLGRKPQLRMHAMHGAAGVALLGLLATIPGLINLIAVVSGAERARPTYVYVAQTVVFALMATFLVVAVNSFMAARRQREFAAPA
ncbi:MAG: hypothetical protein QM770_20850 [Tepidisphaeraceae bacterium]